MKRKLNLLFLQLSWSGDSYNISNTEENDEVIAEALQPHPFIKRLHLVFYKAVKFPSWMMNFNSLPNLVEVSLEDCRRCEPLPPLGLLPHLKVLKIIRMHSLKCFVNEFYYVVKGKGMVKEGLILFPFLEKLDLHELPNLDEWRGRTSPSSFTTTEEGEGELEVLVFPLLESLTNHNCPELRTFPPLPLSIQSLSFGFCREILLTIPLESLPYFSLLSSLTVEGVDGLMSFPDEGMVLRKFSALQSLTIDSSSKLKYVAVGFIRNLFFLSHLSICLCEELVYLPEGLQNLISLQSFQISFSNGLKSLNKNFKISQPFVV